MAQRAKHIGLALTAVLVAAVALASACGLSNEGTGTQTVFKPDASIADNYVPLPDDSDGDIVIDAGATLDGGDGAACPATGRGPSMVRIFGQCIDVTEVTVAQFDAFLADVSDASFPDGSLPNACGYKTGAIPAKDFGRTVDASTLQPTAADAFADYCDALAFCTWAGKRICRGDAGPGTWTDVCTSQGQNAYCYGSDAQAGVCNDIASEAADAGSFPGCRVGDAGPFDMNGNVAEWVGTSCYDAGAGKYVCDVRGGSIAGDAAVNSCARDELRPIDDQQNFIGFRCCAD